MSCNFGHQAHRAVQGAMHHKLDSDIADTRSLNTSTQSLSSTTNSDIKMQNVTPIDIHLRGGSTTIKTTSDLPQPLTTSTRMPKWKKSPSPSFNARAPCLLPSQVMSHQFHFSAIASVASLANMTRSFKFPCFNH